LGIFINTNIMPNRLRQLLADMSGKKVLFILPLIILIVLVIVAIIMAVLFMSSNTSSSYRSGYSNTMADYSSESYAPSAAPMMAVNNSYSSISSKSGSNASIPAADRKIVRSGSIDMLVTKVEDTANNVQSIALKYSGIVEGTNIYNVSSDTKAGSITIRVPNEQFDTVFEAIKALGTKVNKEVVSSQDVSAQYIDLEARLKNKKSVETQYVVLLNKAVKVDEIIQVHQYLDSVREEIERLQAQMNYLSRQVSMSTISISLTSEAEVQVFGITWRPLTVVKQSFKNLLSDLTGIVDWLVWFVFALPGILIKIAIFVGIVWVIIKVFVKVFRRIRKNTPPVQG